MSAQQSALRTVGDSSQGLQRRLTVLEELSTEHDLGVVSGLHSLLKRSRAGGGMAAVNWDPVAAERLVDLHIIRVLHLLGDDSELSRIPKLVSQAGRVLVGPEDELSNASRVILAIGHTEVIGQLAEMATSNDRKVVANVVTVLDRLCLPQPPVGGPIPRVPVLRQAVSFEVRTLKQEMETLALLSKGSIRLSSGVRDFLDTGDYDRGVVRRSGVTLAAVVEQDLSILGFEYFADGPTVVVCTFAEAGQRWQDWWHRYGGVLQFNRDSFALPVPK